MKSSMTSNDANEYIKNDEITPGKKDRMSSSAYAAALAVCLGCMMVGEGFCADDKWDEEKDRTRVLSLMENPGIRKKIAEQLRHQMSQFNVEVRGGVNYWQRVVEKQGNLLMNNALVYGTGKKRAYTLRPSVSEVIGAMEKVEGDKVIPKEIESKLIKLLRIDIRGKD